MSKRHSFYGYGVITAVSLALAWPDASRAALAPSSPFLPANALAAGALSGPAGPVELRGMMATSDGVAYCIYDVGRKKNVWVGMNEGGHDFVVKSADASTDSVTIEYQGRLLRLALRTAKVASSGPPMAPAGAFPGTAPSISSTVVLNPSPADEQRRLDAVSQEVRRRKAERERAIQQTQESQAAGGVPPVPNR